MIHIICHAYLQEEREAKQSNLEKNTRKQGVPLLKSRLLRRLLGESIKINEIVSDSDLLIEENSVKQAAG